MKKDLRPYQNTAIDKIDEALLRNVVRQLLVLATGAGKTFTAVKATEKYNHILWITHTEELLEQSALAFLKEKFDNHFADTVEKIGFLDWVDNQNGLFAMNSDSFKMGAIKADVFIPYGNVVMASAQTLHRRLDKIDPNYFDCIVCDEAHLFGAPTFTKSLEHFTPKLRLGLTATPYRADGMLLGNIFDEIVYEYNIRDGIKDGYLAQLDAVRVKTDLNIDSVRTTAGELNQKDLAQEVNTDERNQLVVDKYIEYGTGRQGIFFCVDVDHAMKLMQKFIDAGIRCKAVTGNDEITPNRSQTIKDFKEGKIDVLTNCMVLTAGFDHPNVGIIGMACPTKSKTKWLQCVGRGTRLKNEEYVAKFGQMAIILDFVDSTSKHRLVNSWEIEKELPPEDRAFISDEKRQKLIDAREAKKIKITAVHKVDIKIDLMQLPEPLVITSMRMSEPATPAQLQWVSRLGYDIINIEYTKAMCNEIINQQPVSQAKLRQLKDWGYDISLGATNGEFSAVERKRFLDEKKGIKQQAINQSPIKGL